MLKNFKNLYQDISNQNSLEMVLPRADKNINNSKYEILLMVSVIDSLGAVANIT